MADDAREIDLRVGVERPEISGRIGGLSADELSQLEAKEAGTIARALTMAEREQIFRHRITWGGLASGLTVALSFLGVSALLISSGRQWSGTVLGTVDMVALVALFVTGQRASKD